MPNKQRTLGQFSTPPAVADLLLTFCLRRATDRVLDPSCGDGAFLSRVQAWQQWMSGRQHGELWGIELDESAVQAAQEACPQATIHQANFFQLDLQTLNTPLFDAVLGNPPYTRADWIADMPALTGSPKGIQLPLFSAPDEQPYPERQALIPPHLWGQAVNRRAGLHAYFMLHSLPFIREGGRLGFVVPNSWLDVAYGEGLKRFILDHFRVVACIEPSIERWFTDAKINTCLLVLEKCNDPAGRQANLARFIQLKQPLADILAAGRDYYNRLESLLVRLLPAADRDTPDAQVRVVRQQEIRPGQRWGIALRAPAVYHRVTKATHLVPLHQWAQVQRGFTSGANNFFYLDENALASWQMENTHLRPLLKSLRGLHRLQLQAEDCAHKVLLIPPTAALNGSATAAYVAWGEEQGLHRRRTPAGRHPWYALPHQEPPPLVLPKGIWRWHLAPCLQGGIYIDQQLYGLYPAEGIPPLVAAALLNSTFFALQLEVRGRVNFGNGVLWLAAYEVRQVLLPDPRALSAAQQEELAGLFAQLAAEKISAGTNEAAWWSVPGRVALDRAVLAIIGQPVSELKALQAALLERISIRLRRAGYEQVEQDG